MRRSWVSGTEGAFLRLRENALAVGTPGNGRSGVEGGGILAFIWGPSLLSAFTVVKARVAGAVP